MSAELCPRSRAGVDPELPEDTLGMMAGGVSADVERVCDGGIGPALCQKRRNLELPTGKSISLLEVRDAPLSCTITSASTPLFL
jgi:hypothetical protein